MEITETGVNERLEALYKQSLNGDGPLKGTIASANNTAEEEKFREIGKAAAINKGTVTQEQQDQIALAASEKAHFQTLQSLKGKTDAALKTSGWEILLEKAMGAFEAVGLILSGQFKAGYEALKGGAGRAISELWDAFKDWKIGSSDHGFMDTVEKHEKLRNLNKLASQELGISDPKERERVVAQLAGDAPLPVQVSGGATVTGDQSPPPVGKTGGKAAGK